jgi:hypothetical protein
MNIISGNYYWIRNIDENKWRPCFIDENYRNGDQYLCMIGMDPEKLDLLDLNMYEFKELERPGDEKENSKVVNLTRHLKEKVREVKEKAIDKGEVIKVQFTNESILDFLDNHLLSDYPEINAMVVAYRVKFKKERQQETNSAGYVVYRFWGNDGVGMIDLEGMVNYLRRKVEGYSTANEF